MEGGCRWFLGGGEHIRRVYLRGFVWDGVSLGMLLFILVARAWYMDRRLEIDRFLQGIFEHAFSRSCLLWLCRCCDARSFVCRLRGRGRRAQG